jgi:hypothetical protein
MCHVTKTNIPSPSSRRGETTGVTMTEGTALVDSLYTSGVDKI